MEVKAIFFLLKLNPVQHEWIMPTARFAARLKADGKIEKQSIILSEKLPNHF
jgi:hypothetical protein